MTEHQDTEVRSELITVTVTCEWEELAHYLHTIIIDLAGDIDPCRHLADLRERLQCHAAKWSARALLSYSETFATLSEKEAAHE